MHPFQELFWITARFSTVALRCTSGEDKLNWFKSNSSTSCFDNINFSLHLFALNTESCQGIKISLLSVLSLHPFMGWSSSKAVLIQKTFTKSPHNGIYDLQEEKASRYNLRSRKTDHTDFCPLESYFLIWTQYWVKNLLLEVYKFVPCTPHTHFFKVSLITTKRRSTNYVLVNIGCLLNWPLLSRMIGNLLSGTGSDNRRGKNKNRKITLKFPIN